MHLITLSIRKNCSATSASDKNFHSEGRNFYNCNKKGYHPSHQQQRPRAMLYSLEVSHHLLSVRKMQQKGLTRTFSQKGVKIRKGGNTIVIGKSQNSLTVLDFEIMTNNLNSNVQILSTERDNYNFWHQSLDHIEKIKFIQLKNKRMINDIGQIDTLTPNDNLCEACINDQHARLLF